MALFNYIFGSKLTFENNVICKRCNHIMDPYGTHALSCPHGGYTIMRHNNIRDVIFKYLKQAGYNVLKEEKFDDNNEDNIDGIPGDIKILNYDINNEFKDLYLDVTVGNVMSQSYVDGAAKQRGYLNQLNEKRKSDKYGNQINIKGLSFETFGAISNNVKDIIKNIARKLEIKQAVHNTVLINRIRSQMVAALMQANGRMLVKSFY